MISMFIISLDYLPLALTILNFHWDIALSVKNYSYKYHNKILILILTIYRELQGALPCPHPWEFILEVAIQWWCHPSHSCKPLHLWFTMPHITPVSQWCPLHPSPHNHPHSCTAHRRRGHPYPVSTIYQHPSFIPTQQLWVSTTDGIRTIQVPVLCDKKDIWPCHHQTFS